MTIRDEFERALGETVDSHGVDADLLPTRLAIAAAEVLPVDGASISVAFDGYRVPLGASDEPSAVAERLQFTTGEGPCMTAIDSGVAISVSEPQLRQRWPELAEAWSRRAGYRSAASHPLYRQGHAHAALNLFFMAADGNQRLDAAALAAVAELLTEQLSAVLGPDLAIAPGTSAENRRRIWIAVGMAMGRWHLDGPDALDRLRANAYARGTTLDALAAHLIDEPDAIAELDD